MRKLISGLTVVAVLFGASDALAQLENFGKSGTMAFSAERLFAIHKTTLDRELPNGDSRDDDWTGFGFGWGASTYPFTIPRFGFDIFVIDQLSVGGSLGYLNLDFDDNDPNTDDDSSAFLLAPRVGYWLGIGSVVGFWPRGGFTYHSFNPPGGDNDESGMALTLEAMFAIGPTEHFAFLVGPTLDLDFTGSRERGCGARNDNDCDWKYRTFGIQFGVMGWL